MIKNTTHLCTRQLIACLFLATGLAPASARAGEVYSGIGFPGLMVGYAHAVSDLVSLRTDFATLGSRTQNGDQEGIHYRGTAKFSRLGVFADYFPWGNGFRLTGGLTINQTKIDLASDFHAGEVVTIGNNTLLVPGSGYYFNVRVKVPNVTPYLGLGWGHQGIESGWGLVADLGASIGRAQVDVSTNLASAGVSQSDIDRETREIRDGVGQIRLIPQATIGISYRY